MFGESADGGVIDGQSAEGISRTRVVASTLGGRTALPVYNRCKHHQDELLRLQELEHTHLPPRGTQRPNSESPTSAHHDIDQSSAGVVPASFPNRHDDFAVAIEIVAPSCFKESLRSAAGDDVDTHLVAIEWRGRCLRGAGTLARRG